MAKQCPIKAKVKQLEYKRAKQIVKQCPIKAKGKQLESKN
jgi:hypothetical protein